MVSVVWLSLIASKYLNNFHDDNRVLCESLCLLSIGALMLGIGWAIGCYFYIFVTVVAKGFSDSI